MVLMRGKWYICNRMKKQPVMRKITKEQYEFAQARIEELLPLVDDNTPADSKNAIELSMMSDIVIAYEKEHFPIEKPTMAELIELSLEEKGMTEKQLATMLFRYAQKQGYDTGNRTDLGGFPDRNTVNDFALEAMQWCVAQGIITGDNGNLSPLKTASRAYCEAFLLLFLKTLDK